MILFSFGLTGFDSSVVPAKFRDSALGALSRLSHKVVLHFDPRKLPNLPSNVLARINIPQQDLLGILITDTNQSKCVVHACIV